VRTRLGAPAETEPPEPRRGRHIACGHIADTPPTWCIRLSVSAQLATGAGWPTRFLEDLEGYVRRRFQPLVTLTAFAITGRARLCDTANDCRNASGNARYPSGRPKVNKDAAALHLWTSTIGLRGHSHPLRSAQASLCLVPSWHGVLKTWPDPGRGVSSRSSGSLQAERSGGKGNLRLLTQ